MTKSAEVAHSGFLDDGESELFTVEAESNPEEWEFDWLGDGTLWVRIKNRDGVEIADLDISEGKPVRLVGGGTFTLAARSVDGFVV